MKLLLTSKGLTSRKIRKEFLKLLNKPPAENRVIVMHTARLRKHFGYLRDIARQLIALGFKKKNICEININKKVNAKKYTNFDVFYSCGGNTFHILNRVRKTGFDKVIKQFVKQNKVYVGVSAGSYIVCPTIEATAWKHADRNTIGLKNLKALNIIPFLITAHYVARFKKIIDKAEANTKYKVKRLTNRQALIISKNKIIRID